jgi:hypothetical protein
MLKIVRLVALVDGKPPSSDPPFARKKRKQKKSKNPKGGQRAHKPYRQQLLDPNESHWLMPERCVCGHSVFDPDQMQPLYVHQHNELPNIEVSFPIKDMIMASSLFVYHNKAATRANADTCYVFVIL